MNLTRLLTLFLFTSSAYSCTGSKKSNTDATNHIATVDSISFKSTINDQEANLYTLKNNNGFTVYLTNFGARIVGIIAPDKEGKLIDVALGFKNAAEYNNPKEPYFGAIVGPVANRIANGKFEIADNIYNLPINNGPNTLHGGKNGLHFVVWNTEVFKDSIRFSYLHPDLQDGFPGNKQIDVTYAVNNQNELTVTYRAITDKETYLNLSNHTYFNMNGEGSGTILDHQLQIFADATTPVDSTLIPTGEITNVAGTPFDFTSLKAIGKDIDIENQQLTYGKGYDHNYVLNETKGKEMNHAAKIIGDKTGITMDIYTTEPGLQFYSGNFMAENVILKNGVKDSFRTGLCLEPQNFPDAPNQPTFPNSKLKPDQIYNSKTIYSFSIN